MPKMPRATVHCPHCKGTGKVPLTGVYADTLILLADIGKRGEQLNGAQLAKLMGVKGEAMCNRLVRLEELGLATSKRYGRQRLWAATKHKGDAP
jgi:Mn-dependent DtxR family transcriptional regulator